LVAPEDFKAALSVQIILAGLYGVLLIAHLIANEHTADAETKRSGEIAFVKTASAKLKSVLDDAEDEKVKRSIGKVYDALYSSPVKSHPNLAQTEDGILQSITALGHAVGENDAANIAALTKTLMSAVNERNAWLKANNG
jgi:hypothetical protein